MEERTPAEICDIPGNAVLIVTGFRKRCITSVSIIAYVDGNYDVTLPANTPRLFYKHFQYSNTGAPMKYLVVNTCTDDIENSILFELVGNATVATDSPKTF